MGLHPAGSKVGLHDPEVEQAQQDVLGFGFTQSVEDTSCDALASGHTELGTLDGFVIHRSELQRSDELVHGLLEVAVQKLAIAPVHLDDGVDV